MCDKSKKTNETKYVKKKDMTTKNIHLDMVLILDEDAPSYATVGKWTAEFKRDRDSTDEQVDVNHWMVLDIRLLTVQHITKIHGHWLWFGPLF